MVRGKAIQVEDSPSVILIWQKCGTWGLIIKGDKCSDPDTAKHLSHVLQVMWWIRSHYSVPCKIKPLSI